MCSVDQARFSHRRGRDRTYLADADRESSLLPLQAPRAPTASRSGHERAEGAESAKRADRGQILHAGPVSNSTASLFMRRCAGAPISAKNWSSSAAISPARPSPTNGSSATGRLSRVATEESVQRRHHSCRHVAAGVHAAAGRAGAAAALTSDPLPWRAGAEREVALVKSFPVRQSLRPSPQAMTLRAGHPARLSWARLLKQVFDIDIEHCPNCGGSLKSSPPSKIRR